MFEKILKNRSGSKLQFLNRDIENNDEYNVGTHFWLELAADAYIYDLVSSGDVIVNNGNEDLSSSVGLVHITDGVIKTVDEISMIPGVGEFSPAMEEIGSAIAVISLDIGDKFYGHHRMSNIVGDSVKFFWHMCCNNSESDRWGQAIVYCRTSNGNQDKTMNTYDDSTIVGPVEFPTTPYLIFTVESLIPISFFQNDENLLFIGVERTEPTGKISPDNPILILKYSVEYWQRQSK